MATPNFHTYFSKKDGLIKGLSVNFDVDRTDTPLGDRGESFQY